MKIRRPFLAGSVLQDENACVQNDVLQNIGDNTTSTNKQCQDGLFLILYPSEIPKIPKYELVGLAESRTTRPMSSGAGWA
jgi:hypothetical protein